MSPRPIADRTLVLLFAAVLAGRLWACVHMAGQTDLTVWADRDLMRALTAPWQAFGPEINGGARPPGGIFYLLLGGFLAVDPTVVSVHLGLLGLFTLSLLLLAVGFARQSTSRAGWAAAVLLAGSPMLGDVLAIWNPGFVLFFATAATVWGHRFLSRGDVWSLGLAAAAIAIGLQIHLQMWIPAAALVLAWPLYRPHCDRRHALALGLGLVLPVLPSLGVALLLPLPGSPAAPSGIAGNYLWGLPQLQEKLMLAFALLGGPTATPQAMAPWPAIRIAADLVAVLVTAAGLAVPAWRRRFATGPFLLAALLVLAEIALASVNTRHLVAALPALACLGGLAVDRMVAWAASRTATRLPAGGLAALVCLLMAARPLGLAAETLDQPAFQPGSVPLQAEIAAAIKGSITTDPDAFDARTALFWRPRPGSWQLVQEGVSGQMAFVFRTTPAVSAGSVATGCLAVIHKSDADAETPGSLARSPVFAGLAPRFGEAVAQSAHFLVLPYSTADGNCLKSFPNAYLPSRQETDLPPPGQPDSWRRTADGLLFATHLADDPFPIGLLLQRDEQTGRFRAQLIGRPLRGYTGLGFLTLISPGLCLVEQDAAHWIPLALLTVGSPQRGTLAPWRSPSFADPADPVRAWLMGRDGKSSRTLVRALGRIDFNDLSADPAPDPLAPPPPGCPMPEGRG
jgi:hypothetical protein